MALSDDETGPALGGENAFAYPLFPYLLAAMCALGAAASAPGMRNLACLFLMSGLALFLANFSLSLLPCGERSPFKETAYVFRILGVFFVGAFYFYFRTEPNPYPDFAPSQTELELRIEDVSRGSGAMLYGTALVERAPRDLPKLAGMRVWFSVFADTPSLLPDVSPSEVVGMRGILSRTGMESPMQFSNKDSDKFDEYLKGRMVFFKFVARAPNIVSVGKAGPISSFVESARAYMLRSLSELPFGIASESEAARTYRAMMLGDKSLISAEQKQNFRDTGTMHIFAVSGLHVGFAAGALFAALSLLRVNWRLQPALALPFLLLYVFACGAKPSSVRAFAMIAIVWIASAIGRGSGAFAALILAAFAALIVNPLELFDAGFTLSYAIVASIFIFGLPLYRCAYSALGSAIPLGRGRAFSALRSLLNWTVCAFSISLGAMLASFPLGAHYFSSVSPMAVLYSPFFVSAAGFVVALGFAGFFLPSFVACMLNLLAVMIVRAMNLCASLGAENGLAQGFGFSMPSGLATAIALAAFLCIPSIFSNRGFFLRFCLAPIAMFAIMALSQLYA